MIVSFHPIYAADENIICAGRQPDRQDLKVIRAADAVILPQGCTPELHAMARSNCRHVFPNFDTRFAYPDKLAQIRLFDELPLPHPPTACFGSVAEFHKTAPSLALPMVIKLNWGGEGQTTFKAEDESELNVVLERVSAAERSGQRGFLVQQWIPTANRSLRVAVIGRHIQSYWRVQPRSDQFGTAISSGAYVDHNTDADLQAAGRASAEQICTLTGLQLVGLDYIFDNQKLEKGKQEPLILEINHFFGRWGLGGSENFYRILIREIDAWLERRNLKNSQRPNGSSATGTV